MSSAHLGQQEEGEALQDAMGTGREASPRPWAHVDPHSAPAELTEDNDPPRTDAASPKQPLKAQRAGARDFFFQRHS